MNIIKIARLIATGAHYGQKRRGGADYIEHPEAVARVVANLWDKKHPDWVIAAALLHDVLEDTNVTGVDLLDVFGSHPDYEEMASTVGVLTHNKNHTYEEYIQAIAQHSTEAIDIKLADIFCNINDNPTDRQREKYKKAAKILKGEA